MKSTGNRLKDETSPYLLQHAHNPVDWYPWGPEALEKAKKENKPILVSIGYAACHWCHVMERESFENDATAEIMNTHFVNIKIDREERPDLDHIYMDAVQAMTGSGGWPLNVFLTPDTKPFYGGTYFPPQKAFNRPSWTETLYGVAQAFRERRHEIDAQAENLTEHLLNANAFGIKMPEEADTLFHPEKLQECFTQYMKTADRQWGGFGKAPKFPQTFSIQFLLRHHYFTGEPAALEQALLSLDKMIDGGIYDQAGGGFARYSTDAEWLAPHFEKMLYDNALLVSVLSEAYQLTHKPRYREVIDETLAFIEREMMHPGGGFYSALDADSEGVEGKFYTWSRQELESELGEEAAAFCAYYDVSEAGNWEHTNILWIRKPMAEVAQSLKMEEAALSELLARGRKRLMEIRANRIRPLLDDKVLLGWNALMNTAYCKAYEATGNEKYRDQALRNMDFLLSAFRDETGQYRHTWKNGQARYPAFLDDLAFLLQAMLQLQQVTGDLNWLERSRELVRLIIEKYQEPGTPYFFYTPDDQEDVIVRKKEVYDGALPSGNAVMAICLYHMSVIFDMKEWKERSLDMYRMLGNAITRYPVSFGVWAMGVQEVVEGTNEIVLTGDNPEVLMADLLGRYVPNKVVLTTGIKKLDIPLLEGRKGEGKPSIYLCRNNTCQAPVFSADSLISLINRDKKQ
ncbi:MAG TPA: thioredoxin domain-containing protein [Chitinophagaceae bacterium]|nr:thioredoxin domain-containing protein [Chitinophagaceae bacterium]HPH30842.1 thioredoxin domain-containing protein [Chitinophagaceae bacterium]HPN58046.1 thioredoxin domain-containing protein [Chitinophagaceae bacterium]